MEFLSAFIIMFLCTKFGYVVTYEARVTPLKYKITLVPFIHDIDRSRVGSFDGNAKIYIRSNSEGVTYFDIPSYDLLYSKTDLYNIETDELIKTKFSYGTHIISLEFKEPMDETAVYMVDLSFHGKMGLDKALKWDIFTDYKGDKRFVVWTEMGMNNARSVFPCFIEPYYRNTFEIGIVVTVGYEGYSNGAIYGESVKDLSDRFHFHYIYHETPEMPSYLVSIVMMKSNRLSVSWIKIRLVKESPDKSTDIAEDVLSRASKFYEATFRRSYSSLGNPSFLVVGHYCFHRNSFLQTWGIGFFDEELITSDVEMTTMEAQLMRTKLSAAVSQLWHANAISPNNWTDLWVTKALTKYYEYIGTHGIFPKFDLDVQFVTEEMHTAMWLENYNIKLSFTNNEFFAKDYADSMLNSWLYSKAASVIRMFSHAMTPPRFADMMRNFISKNLTGTFAHTDLRESMALYWPSNSNVNVKSLYENWIYAVGVPAVNVSIAKDKKSARFTRIRDCIYIPVPQNFPMIPLTYVTSKMPNSTDTFSYVYMPSGEDTAIVNFTHPVEWIIVNNQRVGFYRALYTESMYELFKKELMKANHSQIHQLNRAQLIDDLFYFHICKFVSSQTLFSFLEYLRNESDYAPWKAAMEGFIHLSTILDPKDLPYLEEFVWFLSENVYHDLGMFPKEKETVLQRHLRNLVLNTNCRFRQQNISDRAIEMVWDLTKDKEKYIPREILTTIICCGVRRITNQEYNILLDIYKNDVYVKYKRNLFDGMACTQSPLSLEKYFNMTVASLPVEEREAIFSKILRENPSNAWFLYILLTKDFYKLLDTFHNKIRMVQVLRNIGILLDYNEFLHWEAYMDRNIEQYSQVVEITTNAHFVRRFHNHWRFDQYWDLKVYLRNRTWLPEIPPEVEVSGSIQSSAFPKFFMISLFLKFCFDIIAELVL